jgi:hypothetical protein
MSKRKVVSNDLLLFVFQLEQIDAQLENMLAVKKDDMSKKQLKAVSQASSRLFNAISDLRTAVDIKSYHTTPTAKR